MGASKPGRGASRNRQPAAAGRWTTGRAMAHGRLFPLCDAQALVRHACMPVSVCVRVGRERNRPIAKERREEKPWETETARKYRAGGWGILALLLLAAVVLCCCLLLSSSPTYTGKGGKEGGQRLLREAQHHDRLSRAERARHAYTCLVLFPSPPPQKRRASGAGVARTERDGG